MSLVGSDVVALYPSLTSKRTGEIVRESIENSEVTFEGFNDEKGRAYIGMNRSYAGNIEEIEHTLPTRASNKVSTPTMASVGTKWDPNEQWVFPEGKITEKERRKIIAKVTEIAVRILREKFSYKFGGKNYHQKSGGPIGVRATGAASQLVMEHWAKKYREILENSGVWVAMMGGYVDDGRQITTVLEKGYRFKKEENSFVFTQEGYREDIKKEKNGESRNEFMGRVCIEAMQSINKDLKFTTESQENFETERLPTLDFELWLEKGKIHHSYYQKPMKTPYILMARSAMSYQQKMQINSNELTRRLSNIRIESVNQKEINQIIEQFIQELKNSGYNQKQAKEIVCSGIKGWKVSLSIRWNLFASFVGSS